MGCEKVAGAIILAGWGCTGPSEDASVQFLQADPGLTAPVSFRVDNATLAAGIGYGQSSPRFEIPAGRRQFRIESGSEALVVLEERVQAGARYYLVSAAGDLTLSRAGPIESGGVLLPPDTGQRNPTRAHIRFVNVPGSPAEPPVVHAYLEAPATVDTTVRFGIDTRVASYGPLIYLDPGTVTVNISPETGRAILIGETFTVARGEVKAVVLERAPGGMLRLRIVVEQ